jgi:peptidase M28-like protein
MICRLLAALLVPLLAGAVAVQAAEDPNFSAERFRAHVAYLADDSLEGRDTGSPGFVLAAAYVTAQYRALGLKPAGGNGDWFQQVPLRSARLAKEPFLTLIGPDGKQSKLQNGMEMILGPSTVELEQDITAPVVFAGFGLDAPNLGLRDYKGLDVRGRIVAVLAGAPRKLDSETAAYLVERKAAMAAHRGAVGLVILPTDESERATPWTVRVRRSGGVQMDWIGAEDEEVRFTATFSQAAADQLFAGAARSLASVRADAAKGIGQRGFVLPAQVRVQRTSLWSDIRSPEVIGLLPGSDPKLRNEYVVLMAHLDHLGIGRGSGRPGEDLIFNGALDNAAGIATMLEAARAFVSSGKPPRRSILFIANTAEEKGLLGADYFAHHPTVSIDRIVAGVDLDMPVLLYDFTDVIPFGAEHSTVGLAVEKAARAMNIAVSPDPMPEQHIFVRSDHYMFVKRGVPAILLMTGFANGGEAQWQHYLATTYHNVGDDLSQPIRWDVGAKFARLNYLIARQLADADQRPRWYRGNLFGNLYAPGAPRAPCTRAGGCGPRLDFKPLRP